MSKTLKLVLYILAAGYLAFSTVQWIVTRGDARATYLLYQAEVKKADGIQLAHDKKIAEYKKDISTLMGYADSLNSEVAKAGIEDTKKAGEIGKLKEKLKGITDKDEKITLLETVVSDQDERIAGILASLEKSRAEATNLREANKKLQLSIDEWMGKFDIEHQLRLKAEAGFNKATAKLAIVQKASKLKTYVVIGAGLIVAGSFLK